MLLGRFLFIAVLYYFFYSAADVAQGATKKAVKYTKKVIDHIKDSSDSSSDSSSSEDTKKHLRRLYENLGE